ncbi:MAG: helix-turn-helix domain-containing protein [Bacteroidota bacterium]|nr:helix-turn-helix domain-containing protein [Bacteroidota bacterium]
MKHIPIHKMQETANIGLLLHYTDEMRMKKKTDALGVHRDDHYIFFIIEGGSVVMAVDFTEVEIPERNIYYVLPGQVHCFADSRNANGWFMAIDTSLIPNEFREIFEDHLILQQSYLLSTEKYEQCHKLIRLLNDAYKSDPNEPFYLQTVYSLLNCFLGIAAAGYSNYLKNVKASSRPKQIVQDFKRLLSENFLVEKSPSVYAGMLNISGSYLNEALSKVTGLSVSYWINHQVILEAKRLLYYTQLTVKEIAHQLGYEDHTYFSRIFKNTEGKTPLAFRDSYRK